LTIIGPHKEPAMEVIPFNEDKENKLATRIFSEVISVEGVLDKLGFVLFAIDS